MMRPLAITCNVLLCGAWTLSACATDTPADSPSRSLAALSASSGDEPPAPPRPPPEAIEACKGATEGAACSVNLRDHSMQGTCRKHGTAGELACAPNRPPPPHEGGPPQEALAACKGKSAGDTCSLTLGAREMDGTCRQGPDGQGELACAPSRPPPREHARQ